MSKNFQELMFERNAEAFLRDNAQAILQAAPQGQRGVIVAAQCPDGTVNFRFLTAKALLLCIQGGDSDGMRSIAEKLLLASMEADSQTELIVAVTSGTRWWVGALRFEPNPPEPQDIAT